MELKKQNKIPGVQEDEHSNISAFNCILGLGVSHFGAYCIFSLSSWTDSRLFENISNRAAKL